MLTLTMNAAEKRVQFLLSDGETLLCAEDWLARKNGTELLVPALAQACRGLGLAPAAIARVACVAGPGGFTGLRLGLATSAALSRANGAKQAGLDYLQALAASVPALPGQTLAVLVNAKRGFYYHGLYRLDAQGLPLPQTGITLRPLPGRPPAPADPAPDFALGSALSAHASLFRPLFPATRFLPEDWDHPTAAALLKLTRAVPWDQIGTSDISPLYLRECDAVENLDDLAARQGLDPARAHADLRRLMTSPL